MSVNSVPIPPRDRGPLLTLAVALAVAGVGIAILHHHDDAASQPPGAVASAAPSPAPPPAAPAQPPPVQVAHASAAAMPAQAPPPPSVETPRFSRRGSEALSRAARADGPERLLREANDSFERGNTAGALARTRQAIAGGAGAPAHVLMGTLLVNLHNYKDAEPELAEAIRLDPDNDEAHRLLLLLRRTAAEQTAP